MARRSQRAHSARTSSTGPNSSPFLTQGFCGLEKTGPELVSAVEGLRGNLRAAKCHVSVLRSR